MGTYWLPGCAGWFGSAQGMVSPSKAGRGRGPRGLVRNWLALRRCFLRRTRLCFGQQNCSPGPAGASTTNSAKPPEIAAGSFPSCPLLPRSPGFLLLARILLDTLKPCSSLNALLTSASTTLSLLGTSTGVSLGLCVFIPANKLHALLRTAAQRRAPQPSAGLHPPWFFTTF